MIHILYEDNHLLVLDKPHGVPTQGEGSLEEAARQYIKQRDEKPGNVFVYAVHRIDAPVAGVVLFAKSKKALSRLSEMQRCSEIEKKYIASVEGKLKEPRGTWTDTLLKKSHYSVVAPSGKKSTLMYEVKGNIVYITLLTGRYHQIRVQFSSRGHPIYGDTKYGSTHTYKNGIALIHREMTLIHPTLKKKMTFRTKNKLRSV